MLLALSLPAEAQQPKKVPQIGYLIGSSPSAVAHQIEGFRQGLRDLGYIEGKNILLEYRYAEEKLDRLARSGGRTRASQGRRACSGNPAAIHAAKDATKTIPIVIILTEIQSRLG